MINTYLLEPYSERRKRRIVAKLISGATIGKLLGRRNIFFITLTSSPESGNIVESFSKLYKKIKYDFGNNVAYMYVLNLNKDKKQIHMHLMLAMEKHINGSVKFNKDYIVKYWNMIHNAFQVSICRIKDNDDFFVRVNYMKENSDSSPDDDLYYRQLNITKKSSNSANWVTNEYGSLYNKVTDNMNNIIPDYDFEESFNNEFHNFLKIIEKQSKKYAEVRENLKKFGYNISYRTSRNFLPSKSTELYKQLIEAFTKFKIETFKYEVFYKLISLAIKRTNSNRPDNKSINTEIIKIIDNLPDELKNLKLL